MNKQFSTGMAAIGVAGLLGLLALAVLAVRILGTGLGGNLL